MEILKFMTRCVATSMTSCMATLTVTVPLLGISASVIFGDPVPAWAKPADITAESEFLQNRLEQPENHFLLDGTQGFISGREFYQATGEPTPFLWPTQPFLHLGPDRTWQTDSVPLVFHAKGGFVPNGNTGVGIGDVDWEMLDGLRLHGGIDLEDALSSHSYATRRALVGGKPEGLAWLGGNLPLRSLANVGGSFAHRGATLAVQANQGWWWTASPVSGRVYPWEGYNAELAYRVGEDFDLSLVDQEWDLPIHQSFYRTHYGRSELNMGFLGASEGGWVWRLDVGFQRREMISDSLFMPFVEKTYPTRFRYRQDWHAPDSLPLEMISQGALGFRDRLITLLHSSEFKEKFGSHQIRQIVKGYYRHSMQGYKVPTENFVEDTGWVAQSKPGIQARGVSAELEYREKRKNFEIGISGNQVLEWEAPLFHLQYMDTINGARIRSGAYTGSDYVLENASLRLFAGGILGWGEKERGGYWNVQAGWRDFWGHDAKAMEFRPSSEWLGLGMGWDFHTVLKLAAQFDYVGEKQVRGWGSDFLVPSHFENNVSVSHAFAADKLQLSLSLLHAFGEKVLEQPNGNPLSYRVIGAVQGSF